MISWRAILFMLVFLSVWGGGHAYLYERLIRRQHRLPALRRLSLVVLWISLLMVPAVFLGRTVGLRLTDLGGFALVVYLNMGFFLVLLPLVMAWDVLRGVIVGGLSVMRRRVARRGTELPPDTGRRQFLAGTANLGIVSLSGGMTVVGYQEARRLAQVKEVAIPLQGLPESLRGLRIVQLSDIHLGPTIKGDYLRAIVERSNQLRPDLVVITGDLADGFVTSMGPHIVPLAGLEARHGSFFVTGNHEYYWDAAAWSEAVAGQGVTVLNNSHRMLEHDGGRILLAGATDYSAHRYLPGHASDPLAARTGAGAADVSILLAHQPKSAFAGVRAGYDLQLSGHVHGGQFFPWNLMIGLVQPFDTGLHRVRKRMWLYVSAGTGYWGPPLRTGVPSEITLLRLQPA